MPGNYLFVCIGNRDLQGVYKIPGSHRRDRISVADLKKSGNLGIKLLFHNGVKERTFKEKLDPGNLVGITFPIFCKALEYLKDNRFTRIDRLFLIATRRDMLIPHLTRIKDAWEAGFESGETFNELHEYLEEGILSHASKDRTSETAHYMAERLIKEENPVYGVEIGSIEVLDLGSYGYFDSLLKKEPSQIGEKDLQKADINTLDFFETEIFQALSPYFSELESSRVFMGTYSGGMPMMQRALDNVLFSIVSYADYQRIFTSEYLSYQVDHRLQGKSLRLVKQLNDNVMRLDWDTAEYVLGRIEAQTPPLLAPGRTKKLNGLIQRAKRISSDPGRWLVNFTSLILRSLYTLNLNQLVVWMVSLEEAALLHLARLQQDKLWKRIIDNQLVELKPAGQDEYVIEKLNLQQLINRKYGIEDELRTAFSGYIDLFLEPGDLSSKDEWNDIKKLRNNLLHNGVPVREDKGNLDRILSFLCVDQKILGNAISQIQNNNLAWVMDNFESGLLKNGFFGPLAEIAGFQGRILPERKLCEEYIQLLHKG